MCHSYMRLPFGACMRWRCACQGCGVPRMPQLHGGSLHAACWCPWVWCTEAVFREALRHERHVQALRELAVKQSELEDVCTTAFAKCLYMVFGVELDREAVADAWGGMASAKVARSQLDSSTALDIFSFVGDDIADVLHSVAPCRSKLLRHKSIIEQLLKAFPHPPDEVRRLALHPSGAAPSAVGLSPSPHQLHVVWCVCWLADLTCLVLVRALPQLWCRSLVHRPPACGRS